MSFTAGRDRAKPMAAEIDSRNEFPAGLWQEMGEWLLGITVPERFGGAGMGTSRTLWWSRKLPGQRFGQPELVRTRTCAEPATLNATDAQKQVPARPDFGRRAAAVSGAGAGSDVVGMKLHAEANDRFILNGSKYWITNGEATRRGLRQADPAAGSRGSRPSSSKRTCPFSQSDHHAPGVRTRSSWCRLEVPFDNILGEEGQGVKVLMSGLDYERVVLAGIGTGIMAACLDEIMPYLVERKQFGQPIGNFQLMQGKIADMYTKLNSARAYVYEVARACDRGEVTRQDAAACVLYSSEEAGRRAPGRAGHGRGDHERHARQPTVPRCQTHGNRCRHV